MDLMVDTNQLTMLADRIVDALGAKDDHLTQIRVTVSYGSYCATLLIEPLNNDGEGLLKAIARTLSRISDHDDRIDFCSSRMVRFNVVGTNAHTKIGNVHRALKKFLTDAKIPFEEKNEVLR